MRKLIFLSSLILGLITIEAKGQPGIGCFRASDGFLYSQKNVFGYYELLGQRYPTSSPSCPRVQLGSKTGSTCQFVALGTVHDEYNYVLLTATGPVQCDLDHYCYGALVLAALLAVRNIKKL